MKVDLETEVHLVMTPAEALVLYNHLGETEDNAVDPHFYALNKQLAAIKAAA